MIMNVLNRVRCASTEKIVCATVDKLLVRCVCVCVLADSINGWLCGEPLQLVLIDAGSLRSPANEIWANDYYYWPEILRPQLNLSFRMHFIAAANIFDRKRSGNRTMASEKFRGSLVERTTECALFCTITCTSTSKWSNFNCKMHVKFPFPYIKTPKSNKKKTNRLNQSHRPKCEQYPRFIISISGMARHTSQ